jgi:DNA-binding CsgD family transcriptional regulator
MKSRNDLNITFMGNLQRAWYASEVADAQDIEQLLVQFKNHGMFTHPTAPLFYVIDYTAQQYLVMTNEIQSMSGYHPSEFLESRLEKLLDVYHKDDFKIYNQQVFSLNTSFLKATPQASHHQYVFSYNFRFVRQDKKMAQVLQRGSYITSKETGLPLYSLGMVIDITQFKTDTVMVHTIAKAVDSKKELISTNYFYPNFEDSLLTRQEKVVLQYLSEGYSSKQVADKLSLSEYTIVNHKQNMLHKTNTKNITEMVAFAIRNRLI